MQSPLALGVGQLRALQSLSVRLTLAEILMENWLRETFWVYCMEEPL